MKNSSERKPSKLAKGQVWQFGRHRLLVGDALDANMVKKLIGTDKIHCVLTDVPYGISYTESKENFSTVKVNKKILNDNISGAGQAAHDEHPARA